MKIYNYNPDNGEFLSEADARLSPLEKDVFLVPANATKLKPKKPSKNKVCVFDDGAWVEVDDYRGKEVDVLGGVFVIDKIGVKPDDITPTKSEIDSFNKGKRISVIKAELSALDAKSIRPMREGDTEYLATIKAQVTVLRAELQGLLND